MGILRVWDGSEWVDVLGTVTDHGLLTGLTDDDHAQYVLADGSRGFSATVSGVAPVDLDDLATKNYVDIQWNKQLTMSNLVEEDDITIWRNTSNRTITSLHTTFSGTAIAQASWSIFHGPDRYNGPTTGVELSTGGYTTGSGSPSQETFTSFTNPTITGGEYVWMEVTTVTGINFDFSLNFEGTEG